MTNTEGLKRFTCDSRGFMHKVVIFKEGGKYRVEPGRLMVHPGAKVVFVSLLGDKVVPRVWFPNGLTKNDPVPLPEGRPLVVGIAEQAGVFPYAVHVPGDDGADFAEGGSSPRMIVADP
jgi:hypothetical protein